MINHFATLTYSHYHLYHLCAVLFLPPSFSFQMPKQQDVASGVRNSYGYIRSYWNNNPDPEVGLLSSLWLVIGVDCLTILMRTPFHNQTDAYHPIRFPLITHVLLYITSIDARTISNTCPSHFLPPFRCLSPLFSFQVSRRLFDACGVEPEHKKIPSCKNHFDLLNTPTLGDFLMLSPADGHGPMHVQVIDLCLVLALSLILLY